MDVSQNELFPFNKPETVLAHLRRMEALILTVAPELDRESCFRMHGALSLAETTIEPIVIAARSSKAYQARVSLPWFATTTPPETEARLPLQEPRRWRTPADPVQYQPAWPDRGFWRRRR